MQLFFVHVFNKGGTEVLNWQYEFIFDGSRSDCTGKAEFFSFGEATVRCSSAANFAAKSDFVLATAGEELGLVGLCALLALYALLVARGMRAGLALRDPFGRLLAVGLAAILALQVFVIAGGVTDLIPLTGMVMPFLAQGGSSVVTNWVIVALLVRLSDRARRPPPREDVPT